MDMQFVVRSTDLTVENQEKRVQYYGKLDPEKRVYIGKSQRGFFLKFSQEERKIRNGECAYAAFIMAIHDFWTKDPKTKGKKDIADLTVEEQELHYNRLVQDYKRKNKKKAPKKNAITLIAPSIGAMRRAGMSWRAVCEELKRTHHIKVAPNYVIRIMREVDAKLEKYRC